MRIDDLGLAQCGICTDRIPYRQLLAVPKCPPLCPDCAAEYLQRCEADLPPAPAQKPNTEDRKAMTHEEREAAVLAAAREMARQGQPMGWTAICKAAGVDGKWLAPSSKGAHLRPQILEIFGVPADPAADSRTEQLQAEVEQLRAQVRQLGAALEQQTGPAQFLRAQVEASRQAVERCDAEIEQLMADRETAAAQLNAALTLLSALTGEPRLHLLQGGIDAA